MVTADYGSTDLKDLEAIKPHKKEKRPPTSSLIVVLLQGGMQVGGFTAIIPTAAMYRRHGRGLPAAGRRLRDMAGRDRRGRDHIHPAALEPPHRSQGEQFLGVDACARVSVSRAEIKV